MAEEIDKETILAKYSMLEKVAMFCILVGEEATIKIFQNLPVELVEQITTQIAQMGPVDKDASLAILEEFHVLTKSNAYISAGGLDVAKELLYKSLGKAEADRVLEKLAKMTKAKEAFAYLEHVNPKQLADFIKYESPQAIAIILSHMNPVAASEVLDTLDDYVRVKVIMQMATIKDVSPDIVQTMSKVLERKLESLFSSISGVGGVKVVADMLNKMGSKAQDILKNINSINVELAKEIKENMFTFEDLCKLDTQDIMKILAEVDMADVAIALKGSPDEQLEAITAAMSQRAKDRFNEEFDMLGKVKVKDKEAKQRKMLEVAQKLIESGQIERDTDE